MIYLMFSKESNIVNFVHYQPFDIKNGLGKTEDELLEEGILVESLPETPPTMTGKSVVLKVNPLRWEYIDRPLTREEKLQQLVLDGKITQEEMNELL